LTSLREAVLRKSAESRGAQEQFFSENADRIVACAGAVAAALERGGRLLAMGNGGSACDAQHVAVEFMHPVMEKRQALPALALANDTALLTAVGNDADFSMAFVDQLRLLGRKGDVALGISTSGRSANVNRALKAAREMQMLTVGFSGGDGGKIAEWCDFCIHRIQEAHGTLLHILWDLIHLSRGEEDLL
jgi:D-sedoheptulose 7-phosphate isomerase